MTKKHFEAAAEMIRQKPWPDEPTRLAVAAAFAELFRQFNPRFNESRFYEACGLVGGDLYVGNDGRCYWTDTTL